MADWIGNQINSRVTTALASACERTAINKTRERRLRFGKRQAAERESGLDIFPEPYDANEWIEDWGNIGAGGNHDE